MGDLNSAVDILNKDNVKKIGEYLSLIADLYIRPIKTWKKILNNDKSSLEYFVFYILFYGFLVYIITWDFQQALTNLIVNIIITLIPFGVFIIPTKIFSFAYNKNLKADRLYRLFFIFNIQLVPFIHFPILIAEWANVEQPYMIFSNFSVLFDLLIICVIPLILKIKTSQKILWLFSNYIFASLYVICLNKIPEKLPDLKIIMTKAQHFTPYDEYNYMKSQYKQTDFYLVDKSFYLFQEKRNNNFYCRFQLLTLYSSDYITKIVNDRLKNISLHDVKLLDSTIFNSENVFEYYNKIYKHYKKDSTSLKFPFKPLSNYEIKKLDSFHTSFKNNISKDIKLMDSLRKKAVYKSNREYANYIFKYLNQYDSLGKDSTKLKKILLSKRFTYALDFENSTSLLIYSLDDSLVKINLQGIIDRNIQYGKKYENSYIVSKILYYPVFKIFNYEIPVKDYTEEFKNINFKKK